MVAVGIASAPMRWTRALLAVLVVAAVSCGGDDEDAAETGSPPTTEAAEETTTTAAEEETTTTAAGEGSTADVTELDVVATDYAYDLGGPPPTLEPGLVRVTIDNQGAEEHQATLVRLNDGVTLDQFAAEATGDPTGAAALALVSGYGGPNAAAPGGAVTSTQSVDAGNYLMICFIPSPTDGVPHAAKGMVLPFTVEGGDGPAALPAGDLAGEIGLAEFAFTVPSDFDGQGTYAVANDGEQAHEVAIYALADGATVGDAVDALVEATGPPPITPVAGISALAGLRAVDAYIELDLPPGEYAFLCFLPDVAGDGVPHFVNGMAQQVSVT